jgi:4-hydroxybenzoate polyprenyltransferase
MGLAARLSTWGTLIAFSHSVFALPFAIMMMVVVSRTHPLTISVFVLLIVCVVAARTAAMGFNRFIDRAIDARNPRTSSRELPRGAVSEREVLLLTVGSSLVFVAAAGLIGRHCLYLSPVVLLLILGYSLLKRYTSVCHFVLGLALACAPGGVWYAMTGEWSLRPVALMGAVLAWVAGFDILYSCQDEEFDRREGLRSIPARLGVSGSLRVAAALHVVSVAGLILFGQLFSLGTMYWFGLAVFAALLASQHIAVWCRGVGCIDRVFFTRNGLASIMLCVSVLIDSVTR